MKIQAIDTEIIKAYFHSGQPDIPQKTAHEMKEFFDAMPKKVIIPKLNEVIGELNSGGYGKSAYTIACENGFEGSEAEWLLSLKGEQGKQGEKGQKGDPVVFKTETESDITDEGIYLVCGEYYLASPKAWDTDIAKPFEYIGNVNSIDKLGLVADDSKIPNADKIEHKGSLWGVPLLKYKNIQGDGTGATYLILRWDNTTLLVYMTDTADTVPICVGETDLLSEGKKDLSFLYASQGTVGRGEDICGNFAKIKRFFKDGITLQRLVTEKEGFANALKGTATGKAVLLDDVSPVEHGIEAVCESTVTRYGGNIFDGHLRACIHSDANFTNYEKSPVMSELYQSLKIWLPEGDYSVNSSAQINIVRRIIDGTFAQYSKTNTYHDTFTVTQAGFVGFTFRRSDETPWSFDDKIWINAGKNPTQYESYIQPVTFGANEKITSLYPSVTLISEGEMTVYYNRDINKAFAKLEG